MCRLLFFSVSDLCLLKCCLVVGHVQVLLFTNPPLSLRVVSRIVLS